MRYFILLLSLLWISRLTAQNLTTPCFCNPLGAPPAGHTVVTVNSLTALQNEINNASGPKTIYISPGIYDGTTSPYAGSGIGIQVRNSNITIRSTTGNPDDVVIDMGQWNANCGYYGDYPGVQMGFVIADYLLGINDTLENITIADITIRDARYHNIQIQGEYHPRNILIHNVKLINAGQQLLKVNPESLSNPVPNSNITVACSWIGYETTTATTAQGQNGSYTNGVDIHAGYDCIIRDNVFQNIINNPNGIDQPAGAAILVWTNSINTVIERNRIIDCDKGIDVGNWGQNSSTYLCNNGVIVRNNVIRGKIGQVNNYDGPGFEGSQQGISICNSIHVKVLGNTVYNPSNYNDARVRSIELLGANCRYNEFKNNLLCRKFIFRGGAIITDNVFENNWYDSTTTANYTNSLIPGMTVNANGVNPDLSLTAAASVLINQGTTDPDLFSDANNAGFNAQPDIGCFEFAPTANANPCQFTQSTYSVTSPQLGTLFPVKPVFNPVRDDCNCGPLPPPSSGTTHTVSTLSDLQSILYNAHIANDHSPKTIYLTPGDYYLGNNSLDAIYVYTSNITIRSSTGNPDDVTIYGGGFQTNGIILSNFNAGPGGSGTLSNFTLADITLRDVKGNLIQVVSTDRDWENILLHNLRLINPGKSFFYNYSWFGSHSGRIECSLFMYEDTLNAFGFDDTLVINTDMQPLWITAGQGQNWEIYCNEFRHLTAPASATPASHGAKIIRQNFMGPAISTANWNSFYTPLVDQYKIERNLFTDCDKGIYLEKGTNALLTRNLFKGHLLNNPNGTFGSLEAVHLKNGNNNVVLNNSTFNPSNASANSILVQTSNNNTIQNNLCDEVITLSGTGNTNVTNIINAGATHFANTSNSDLHLLSTSLAIDAGTNHALLPVDIDNETTFALPDIGADEFACTIPMLPIANGDSICAGNSATLSAQITTGNAEWYDAATGGNFLGSGIQYTTPILSSSDTVYVLSNQNGCLSATIPVAIHVEAQPAANISGNTTLCAGSTIILTGSGGANMEWSTGSTGTSIAVSPSITTTYSLIVSNGICADTAYHNLQVSSSIQAAITGDTLLCEGESTTLSASGGNDFLWSTSATSSSITLSPVSTLTLSVIVTDGTCSDTAMVLIHVDSAVTANIIGSVTACSGDTLQYNGSGGSSLLWNNASTNANIFLVAQSDTTIRLIASHGACNDTTTLFLSVTQTPNVTVDSFSDNTSCVSPNGTIVINATPNSSVFSIDNGFNFSSGNTFTGLNGGNYFILASNGTCISEGIPLILQEPQHPAAPVILGDSVYCTNNTPDLLNASGETGATFSWMNLNGTILGNGNSFQPSYNTSLIILVQSLNGCQSSGDTIQLIASPLPQIDLGADQLFCEGTNITLMSSNNYINLWSDGSNGSNLIASQAGQYWVLVTDSLGCSNADTIILSAAQTPVANDDQVDCGFESFVNVLLTLNDNGNGNCTILSGPFNGTAQTDNLGNLLYTANPNFNGMDSLKYVYCSGNCTNSCDTATVRILVEEELLLIIPEGFSPNGDGVNDFFVIEGIEAYPQNKIEIVNRWGDVVFTESPYTNNWGGHNLSGKISLGKGTLPEGTYFYIIYPSPDAEPIRGYITIKP